MQFELVDVFTSAPYAGNGLCVFPDAAGLDARQMARITAELKQFESIFLEPTATQDRWRARIFDLFSELDFAGHPLLGAACVLHDHHGGDDVVRHWSFELASGAETVETSRRGAGRYRAVLPQLVARFPTETLDVSRDEVAGWFALKAEHLDAALPLEVVTTGLRYLIVPVRPRVLARARIVHPDLGVALAELGADYAYLLDAESREGRHWNNDGVVEDAATGSAAGCVAAYLHRHGRLHDDERAQLRQGRFMNRPSTIDVSARTVEGELQVVVGGDVVLVGSGQLRELPA